MTLPAQSDVPVASGRRKILLSAGLLVTLLVLLLHAYVYRFLTDDAYISFRYARNLAEGHGLVFNPGFERVEGYSNFLWVLVLATLLRLGCSAELASGVLTLLLTVALWALVARYVWRHPPPAGSPAWLALFPCVALGITRSVAVWSSSGLETRLFETLVVAGVLRLVEEVRSALERRHDVLPMAALLFALASLTRPDGLLLAVCALGTAALHLRASGELKARWLAGSLALYAAVVGGHFLFRISYYGDWLPNTYYAKVGGRTWWDMGLSYLALFVIEYGVVLWIPLIVASIVHHRRRGTTFVPLLVAAIVLPHLLYIASIGGDHFEFRPLDLYFPLVFILLYDGAKQLSVAAHRKWAVPTYLVLVCGGLVALPLQSHWQFPQTYHPGFPGSALETGEGQEFLDPAREALFRWPGLRWIAQTHRDLLRAATRQFVGIRQEEHRMFLATVIPEGRRLLKMVDDGRLPRDLYLALDCIGAVPYITGLRTMDRLGLTDAHVAHQPADRAVRMMAHDKMATLDYARQAGVELWAFHAAHVLLDLTQPWALSELIVRGKDVYLADAGDGLHLVVVLPGGLDLARRRMPRLSFESARDPSVLRPFFARSIARWRSQVEQEPYDLTPTSKLALVLYLSGDSAAAVPLFRQLTMRRPESRLYWFGLAMTTAATGDFDGALLSMDTLLDLVRRSGDTKLLGELQRMRGNMEQDRLRKAR
jgi:hypothetical protein